MHLRSMGILGCQEAFAGLFSRRISIGALLGHGLLEGLEIGLDLAQLLEQLLSLELCV